jgi:pyroglutamyl-peptidase
MTDPRLLVTGFTPWPGVPVNPTETIAATLARDGVPGFDISHAILPVSYRDAGDVLLRHARRTGPFDLAFLMGVDVRADAPALEQFAVNLDHLDVLPGSAQRMDSDGESPFARPIVAGAPSHLASSLPLAQIVRELQATKPVRLSQHAGTFLCNHSYYVALHAGVARHAVFAHVPATDLCAGPDWPWPGRLWDTAALTTLIREVLGAIRPHLAPPTI